MYVNWRLQIIEGIYCSAVEKIKKLLLINNQSSQNIINVEKNLKLSNMNQE